MPTTSPRADLYQRVTDRIVADLEHGVRPWFKPWNAGHAAGRITRPLRHNGVPYAGINVLLLWSEAVSRGFSAPLWMTFRQALALGAHVRKGETGSTVVFADRLKRTDTDDKGEEVERLIPFMKGYTVFNVEQIDGLPELYRGSPAPVLDPVQRIADADAFMSATGVSLRHGGNSAFYSMASDHVQMPPFEAFHDAESYYATLAHELTHWTRHPSRLARDLGRKQWGDAGYAAEELVAELGSAFLSADLGIAPEPREDHAAYLVHWLGVLKGDKRFIFSAAAHAQRATDFVHRLQPDARPEDTPEKQAA